MDQAPQGRVAGEALPDIAIGIVAHHSRRTQAFTLAAQVGAQSITIDTANRGERWCHQVALASLAHHGARWQVLLEDDALPCADFTRLLDEYLAEAHHGIVSLYLGTGAWADSSRMAQREILPRVTAQADAQGARWIEGQGLWHAVGIAIPADMVADALEAMRNSDRASDHALSQWTRAQGMPVHYTWPSLVDHADQRRITGTKRTMPRRAWKTYPPPLDTSPAQ